MNILLVTQYFYPENFKSNDIAFELVKKGHKVTVLTGLPNYPEGNIYDGYSFFNRRKEYINGVKVVRALLIPRGQGGGIRLFLNYFSWAFFASLKAILLAFRNKFDAVIVHEPSPITQGFPAIVVKKIQKIPIYFWVLDLWPESLTSAGGINSRYVLGFFDKIVKYIYNHSDKILISSKGFRKSILDKGSYGDKLIYFPNWSEDSISKGNRNYPIPDLPNEFKVVFAGNIGVSQDMENVMLAALELKYHSNIKFIFVGDGRSKSFVEEFVKDNGLGDNVYLMGKYPIEAMTSFFEKADALLVSLKDELIFNLTVPAKVQAYMSASKPILAMINGEGADLINEAKCGFSAPAGDYKSLAQIIIKLYDLDEEERLNMGKLGFKYYEEHFNMDNCINNLNRIIGGQEK